MKTTSIKKSLTAGLMLIVLFFIAQGALVWWAENLIKKNVVETVRKNTMAASQLNELAILAQQVRRYEKEYFVYVDNADRRAAYQKEWTQTADKISAVLEKMKINTGSVFQSSDLTQIAVWWNAKDFYASEMRKIFMSVQTQAEDVERANIKNTAFVQEKPRNALFSGGVETLVTVGPVMFTPGYVNEMIKAGKDRFSGDLIKGVAQLQAEKTKATLGLADVAQQGFRTMILGVSATALVGILIALVLAQRLPRSLIRPVEELTSIVEKISLGHINKSAGHIGVLEFQGLAKAVERMRLAQEALVNRMRARQTKG